MVRISLPNRLKSYNSNNNSRSTSPNPSSMKDRKGLDGAPDAASKVNGLMLKVVVLKVRGKYFELLAVVPWKQQDG